MTLRDKVVCSTRSTSSARKVLQNPSVNLASASTDATKGERVRRRLFGGISCEDPTNWTTSQLQLIDGTESTTLGYDFKNDCPVVNGNINEYIFEAVDEREVPSFYHAKTSSSFDRRERIGPPNIFANTRKGTSPFVVLMPVHDSIAYNTRSHDIITFADSCKTTENSVQCRKSHYSRRDIDSVQCNTALDDKQSKADHQNGMNRKRTMKQQTLTEYLPVVRCKRQQSVDKKSGNRESSVRKAFAESRSFRSCKAQESSSDLITNSEGLETKACNFDNRRITRSMCA